MNTQKVLAFSMIASLSQANIGNLCCGDNFCCSLKTDKSAECWGGQNFSAPAGTFDGITCHGKAGTAFSSDKSITSCFGSSGYGSTGCTTGDQVIDAASSFWGGCKILAQNKSLSCWGAPTGYGSNSRPTLSECQSMSSSCTAYDLLLTPPSGAYLSVSCGGKRAGHFCCAIADDGSGGNTGAVTCFGKGSASYTPTGFSGSFYQLGCGTDFCCGLKADGSVSCFGNLDQADGSDGRNIPSSITGPYKQIAAGNFALFAINSNGVMDTWGRVFSSDVGPVPADTNTLSPTSCESWKSLPTVAGFGHSCAATTANAVSCWGADYGGQVEDAPSSIVSSGYILYPAQLSNLASTTESSVCEAGSNKGIMIGFSFVLAMLSAQFA